MVGKYSLDEKLKERENGELFKNFEDARRFIKYFINLMENILNYDYDTLSSYFEEDKTEAEIRIFERDYRLIDGNKTCWISVCVRLCREDYSYPKLKIVEFRIIDKYDCYKIDIDHFIYGPIENEEFVTKYLQIINNYIFKYFKNDLSYNKNKKFKHYIKSKNITPSEYIIGCINIYFYNNFIKPKSNMSYDEFLNSEFKLEVDKKTQRIFNKYFFKNI